MQLKNFQICISSSDFFDTTKKSAEFPIPVNIFGEPPKSAAFQFPKHFPDTFDTKALSR
jgi:hypothetical protein